MTLNSSLASRVRRLEQLQAPQFDRAAAMRVKREARLAMTPAERDAAAQSYLSLCLTEMKKPDPSDPVSRMQCSRARRHLAAQNLNRGEIEP